MAQQTYLSREGVKTLEKELQELKTTKRQEIAKRLQEAKDLGDLSENAEYFEAKEAQSLNENRIAELEKLFKNIVVIETPKEEGSVRIGSTVEVKSANDGVEKFSIVGSTEATKETWFAAYRLSQASFAKSLQGQLILTETVKKPTHTDGTQQYTTKDNKPDPLLSIFQEVFGEGANRFNHSHDQWTTELIPKVKEAIQKRFKSKGLIIPNFEVILTPSIIFNQQTTLNHPENSQNNTFEWNHDPLLKQDKTDRGRRLVVGDSVYGGAGYVDLVRRGGPWDRRGGRLSVVFPRS